MASVDEDREGKRKAEGKQELSVEGTVLPHTCHSHTRDLGGFRHTSSYGDS